MIETNGLEVPYIELPTKVLRRLQAEFELAVFEPVFNGGTEDPEILEALAAAYYNLEMFDDAISIDSRWAGILPFAAGPHYEMARAYAATRMTSEALEALGKAISLGFEDFERLAADPAFDSVRKLSEFKAMIESTGNVI